MSANEGTSQRVYAPKGSEKSSLSFDQQGFCKGVHASIIMNAKHRGYILVLLAFCLTGLAWTAAAQKDPEPQEILKTTYTLGSGDRLKITVFREDDLSGEFRVDGSGYISFPLIGEVKARGLTMRQLEESLVNKLLDGYLVDPRISLEVLNYRPFYILGEVKNPGEYEYVSGINLQNAVAMAGGYTHRARQNKAEIRRYNPEKVIENADHSTVILPGDTITIRERFF
jgi:polysaccharide biosynthesis/export protein VpsN